MDGKAAVENRCGNYRDSENGRVARRKRRVLRTVRNSFFNVTLERSYYDLRLSSRTIPWKKRKMRERSKFPTKYYTLFRQILSI